MRRGLRWVPLALLLTAVVEIAVFAVVGRWLGFGAAVLLVLVSSLAGAALLRREGVRAWRGFRAAISAGRPPGEQVTDGVVGLGAGALMALPGLVTGLVGLLFVLPPLRRLGRWLLRYSIERWMPSPMAGELFGPRRVRVRPGQTRAQRVRPDVAPPPGDDESVITVEGEVEGEIVDPSPR